LPCYFSEQNLVFSNHCGNPIDLHNFRKRHFLKDIQEAGVPEIRIHDLRHTYASQYMMSGGNIFDLQKILGHSDLKMTMRYAHLSRGHIVDKANLLIWAPPMYKEPSHHLFITKTKTRAYRNL